MLFFTMSHSVCNYWNSRCFNRNSEWGGILWEPSTQTLGPVSPLPLITQGALGELFNMY